MFITFAQSFFNFFSPGGGVEGYQRNLKLLEIPEGRGGGGVIFLHKNGNSLRGGGMDIFWNYTLFFKLAIR